MSDSELLDSLDPVTLGRLPTVILPIDALLLDDSPRQDGQNDEHARILADSEGKLPAILVHGQSMRVIDGMHRVRAAMMRGEERIEAKIYHGTDDDAFMLAVRANIAHGLPLTRADRIAAAIRIIGSHPQWSNRMIAITTGLSAGTIGKLRGRSTAHGAQSNARLGKDGRVRPITTTLGRLKAGDLLIEKPTASIRAIAKEAGVSPSTVHDVQRRLRAGEAVTPERQRAQEPAAMPRPLDVGPAPEASGEPESSRCTDLATVLTTLNRDPALRFSDSGRRLLRLLNRHRVEAVDSNKIAEIIPDHCVGSVANLAREYGRVWIELAIQLEERWHPKSP